MRRVGSRRCRDGQDCHVGSGHTCTAYIGWTAAASRRPHQEGAGKSDPRQHDAPRATPARVAMTTVDLETVAT